MIKEVSSAAVILAGGLGRRMGADKSALMMGGKTLLERAVSNLEKRFDTIIVSLAAGAADTIERRPSGPVYVFDEFPGRGPLAGIHAAMKNVARDFYFAVACDMPFPDAALGLDMIHRASVGGMDVIIPRTADGRLHTLHAAYSRACLPHIERRLAAGDNMIISFFDSVAVRHIEEEELKRWNPELHFLININTDGDFRAALDIDARRRGDV